MINSIMTAKTRAREVLLPYIGPAAMLALVAAIMLTRWGSPETAFLQGMLFGFSIVGNLFSLWQWRQKGRE